MVEEERKVRSDMQNGASTINGKKILDRTVLVGSTGAWIALSDGEYQKYKSGKIDSMLFSSLEEKEIIVTERNRSKVYENLQFRKPQITQSTSLHIVVVTLRCNANCVYCHANAHSVSDKAYDMTLETAKRVVDFIFQSPSQNIYIEFQGGEPLLNFEVVKFIINYSNELKTALNKSVFFSLVTNLSLMTDEILSFLQANHVKLTTSVDGHAELHLKNRPMQRQSFERAMDWVQKINSGNGENLSALLTVTKFSLAYPREIVDTYKRLGFKTVWFRTVNNMGIASQAWESLSYSAEDYFKFWKKGVEYAYQQDMTEYSSLLLLKKILQRRDPNFLDLMSPCGAAIGQLAYNFNGDIFTCDEGRMINDDTFKLGTVYEDTFDKILVSPKVVNFVCLSTNDKEPCTSCPYQPFCGICPVYNYANVGQLTPTETPDTRCKILKMQFDYLFERIIGEDEIFKPTIQLLKEQDAKD